MPVKTAPNTRRRIGGLPKLPSTVAETPTVVDALNVFTIMEAERDISCFDGLPGTGKTTAAGFAASRSEKVDWRYCMLPQRATPRAIAEALYVAVFQHKPPAGERLATDLLLDRLVSGDIGLIADEVHHVGLAGMQQLRHLWDKAADEGEQFPLLLVGCGVHQTLEQAAEVRTRIARWVNFDRIADPDSVAAIASSLHPRLAVTSQDVLDRINERIAGYNIRGWHQFAKHIDWATGDSSKGTKPKPLTGADVRKVRSLMHGGGQ